MDSQPKGGWFGTRVGVRLALSLHPSDEPGVYGRLVVKTSSAKTKTKTGKRSMKQIYIHTYVGLLCRWQNARNYMIIQIHAVKIAKNMF